MKATKATNSREKSATELEEVKEKKETQIFKICTKTKQRIKCNEIKGEEHEETVEFFSLFIIRITL